MNELDEHWAEMLNAAMQKAAAGGRSDVADYLRLKAENDLVREAGVEWLFDSLISVALAREHTEAGVTAERIHPHNFAYGSANIAGSLLKVRQGVRCLMLEAGWTRTPADGFMRGGALAIGRLVHFGMPKSNSDIMLIRGENGVKWTETPSTGTGGVFDSDRLLYHFRLFLGN